MSFAEFGWLFAFAVVLHNLEEMIWLPAWTKNVQHWAEPLVPFAFRFAALVLSAFAIGLALAISLEFHSNRYLALLVGYAVAMSVNAIAPHLIFTIKTGSYMPGTATGLLVVMPAGVALVKAVLDGHHMDGMAVLLWGAGVGLSLLGAVRILFKAGHSLEKFAASMNS